MTSRHEQHLSCSNGYSEEQWVDFVLGNLSHAKRQLLEQHLAGCRACRQHVEEWGDLLADHGQLAWSNKAQGTAAALYSAGEQAAEGLEQPYLSEKHMRSLQRHVKQQARWHQLKTKLSEHKYVTGGVAAAVLLLALIFAPQEPAQKKPAHVDQYVLDHEPGAMSFVNAINSARYRVETAEGQNSSGYIWLKDDLSEAFLWLENLPQIGLNDYQAWAISGEQANSLGIIQVVGSEGHLYMDMPLLHPSDLITLTVEPKGGSLSPTSEQILLIVKQK